MRQRRRQRRHQAVLALEHRTFAVRRQHSFGSMDVSMGVQVVCGRCIQHVPLRRDFIFESEVGCWSVARSLRTAIKHAVEVAGFSCRVAVETYRQVCGRYIRWQETAYIGPNRLDQLQSRGGSRSQEDEAGRLPVCVFPPCVLLARVFVVSVQVV